MATRVVRVDSKGRISLGPRWAGRKVRLEPVGDGVHVTVVTTAVPDLDPRCLAETMLELERRRHGSAG